MLHLYRSLIRSKLDYGCVVYRSAKLSYLRMLDPIQNYVLRLCLGAFRTSPCFSLSVESNEPPLNRRRQKLSLQYALRLFWVKYDVVCGVLVERHIQRKVKVHTLDIAPLHSDSPPQKCSGMARVLKGFYSFTCTPTRSSAIAMSHTCLCLPSCSWYSFTNPGGMEG